MPHPCPFRSCSRQRRGPKEDDCRAYGEDSEGVFHQRGCPLYKARRQHEGCGRNGERFDSGHHHSGRHRRPRRSQPIRPEASSHPLPSRQAASLEAFFDTLEDGFRARRRGGDPITLYRRLLHESIVRNEKLASECEALRAAREDSRQRDRAYRTYVAALERVVERLASDRIRASGTAASAAADTRSREVSRQRGKLSAGRDGEIRRRGRREGDEQMPRVSPHPTASHDSSSGGGDAEEIEASTPPRQRRSMQDALHGFYSNGQSPFTPSWRQHSPHDTAEGLRKGKREEEEEVGTEEARAAPPPPPPPPHAPSTTDSPAKAAGHSSTSGAIGDEAGLVDELLALMQRRVRKDQGVVSRLRQGGSEGLTARREGRGEGRRVGPDPLEEEGGIRSAFISTATEKEGEEAPLSRQDLFHDLGLVSTAVDRGGAANTRNQPCEPPTHEVGEADDAIFDDENSDLYESDDLDEEESEASTMNSGDESAESDEDDETQEEAEVDEDLEFSREFDEWKQRLEELLSNDNTPVHP